MPAYPQMFRVRQTFEAPRVDDIPGTVRSELARLSLEKKVKPGQTVAITAGSRGIANIKVIIKTAVAVLSIDRRQAVYRARHGQPWRRHGRRPAGHP